MMNILYKYFFSRKGAKAQKLSTKRMNECKKSSEQCKNNCLLNSEQGSRGASGAEEKNNFCPLPIAHCPLITDN
jgi:hypothetical protein